MTVRTSYCIAVAIGASYNYVLPKFQEGLVVNVPSCTAVGIIGPMKPFIPPRESNINSDDIGRTAQLEVHMTWHMLICAKPCIVAKVSAIQVAYMPSACSGVCTMELVSDIADQIVMSIVTWLVFSFTHPHTTRRSGDPLFSHPPLLSDTIQYIGPPHSGRYRLSLLPHTEPVSPILLVILS